MGLRPHLRQLSRADRLPAAIPNPLQLQPSTQLSRPQAPRVTTDERRWELHLGGDGGQPEGRFAELVDEEFNGLDKWLESVKKAASAARGWVMVGYDLNDGSLFNYIMDTQNLWAVYNMCPVLA